MNGWFVAAYLLGFFVCACLILYEIGENESKPILPLHAVVIMSLFWPLIMPLASFIGWMEEHREAKKLKKSKKKKAKLKP
jgi:hypothetical protein